MRTHITSDRSNDDDASLLRMGPFVALTNDGARSVIVKRCVNVCDPPDTERWWEIKPGDLEFIPLHKDSGVLVVLTPDDHTIGCLGVPRSGSSVARFVSQTSSCPGKALRQRGQNKLNMILALLDYTESFAA